MLRSLREFEFCINKSALTVKFSSLFCFLLALFFTLANQALGQSNVVVVRPKAIHDLLVNPGMGITTFQRFNGQEPNLPLKWSEVGPVTKLPQAAAKPDFPDTSVSYCRWYWNESRESFAGRLWTWRWKKRGRMDKRSRFG